MRFQLEGFQQVAVSTLLSRINRARRDYAEDGELTAVGLTAPTGAGKTVIATALLERLYFGDADRDPDPLLTVLWVTDDKNLNQQTIAKINQASERLDLNRIRFLGDTDERTLEPGYIYFTHIQQLQKNSTLHAVRAGVRSDHRTHGGWDMIANTVADRGKDFVVIVDEAHRGSATTTDRNSIVGAIMNGGITNIGSRQPPASVVLGISATPDRFHQAMASAGRSLKNVEVPPAEVRASGLLKDRIFVKHVAEDQSADNTMLALAVEDLRAADLAWQAHHAATGDRLVEPLLVIQVEAGVTSGRLEAILSTLESQWPLLAGYAVAHAFGDPHGPMTVGGRTVRYIPPEAIAGDDQVRAVLFKNALTTGWDCPRAEVLISYQSKESFTEIAQLIGRLVRTPLASRVVGDDLLNSVTAYLPGYKAEHVARVIRALTENETVQTEFVIESVDCLPNGIVRTEVFELLRFLPSYARPVNTFPSRTAQLMRLAAALNEWHVVPRASTTARQWIVDQMRAADTARSGELDGKVADNLALEVGVVDVGYDSEVSEQAAQIQVATSERDLDGYFARAKRALPDGSAAWYFNDLCDRGVDDTTAMVRVGAMASLGFASTIEKQAEEMIKAWRSAHGGTVSRLDRANRLVIDQMWFVGDHDMIPTSVDLPEVRREGTQRIRDEGLEPIDLFAGHLYSIPEGRSNAGRFPVVTTGWEREVLDAELELDSLVAWYRNPPSGRYALAVPYRFGSSTRLLHPDFLFFHEDSGEIVVDIVDPHRHDDGATAQKWSALAKYAKDHPEHLRRVVAVIRDAHDKLRSLDLTADGIGELMAEATDGGRVAQLFDQYGTDY